MAHQYDRLELLIGEDALNRLSNSHIAVFGIGGVGSYTVEALARSGIGKIDIIDKDIVDITNLNRQLIALCSTIGKPKVDVMKSRIIDINPHCIVNTHHIFYNQDNQLDISHYYYIVDAIDNISAKLLLIKTAHESSIPIISSMGTGNKLNPTMLEVANITDTTVCPLARVMRRELKKLGITSLKVVYSREEPHSDSKQYIDNKQIPASCAFVPSVAGLILASEVIKDIIGK